MSKRNTLSIDVKPRSFRYRINCTQLLKSANHTETSNMSLTIDRSDGSRGTPHFLSDARMTSHKKNPIKYYSKTCRKPRTLYLDMGEIRPELQTLDVKMQTIRTFETFMDRDGSQHWRGKFKIKLPLIEVNPQISLIPFGIEYGLLTQELQSCTISSKCLGEQLSNLREQISTLAQRKKELDPFVQNFMSKCQVLKKSLAQNRFRHLQNITTIREKMGQLDNQVKNLENQISTSIQTTKEVQKSIFNTTYDIQFDHSLMPAM